MKKLLSGFTALMLVLALTACSPTEAVAEMYLQKAELSAEEQSILDLVGSKTAPYILDFVVNDTVQALQINTYELQNGAWTLVGGGGGEQLNDTEGRIALTFDDIGLGLKIGVQSENKNGSTSYYGPEFQFETMDATTSYLTDQTPIEFEKEIPLVIQIHTTENKISSPSPQYGFLDPQTYVDAGYERVYAITCVFSQKTVAELSDASS